VDETLESLFWDSDFKKIDYRKNTSFVIERVLERGDIEHVKIMFKHYTQEEIKRVLRTSRRLSPKSANFWADYFGLQKKDILCLSRQSNQALKSSWPY